MKVTKFLLGVAIVSSIASCGNKDLEARVTKLEGRVAALEGTGTSISSSTAQTIPVTSPATNNPTTPAEKPEGPLPSMKFREELYDFGEVKEGDVVEHVFSFVNEGEAPLIISDAKASCGCTVPEWPKEPIPVGESGEIKVRFNSKNRTGIQNKPVTITANTWPVTTRVTIKGNVIKEEEK